MTSHDWVDRVERDLRVRAGSVHIDRDRVDPRLFIEGSTGTGSWGVPRRAVAAVVVLVCVTVASTWFAFSSGDSEQISSGGPVTVVQSDLTVLVEPGADPEMVDLIGALIVDHPDVATVAFTDAAQVLEDVLASAPDSSDVVGVGSARYDVWFRDEVVFELVWDLTTTPGVSTVVVAGETVRGVRVIFEDAGEDLAPIDPGGLRIPGLLIVETHVWEDGSRASEACVDVQPGLPLDRANAALLMLRSHPDVALTVELGGPCSPNDTIEEPAEITTFPELQGAFAAFLDCATSQGVEIVEATVSVDGSQDVGFGPGTTPSLDSANEIMMTCEQDHFTPTYIRYTADNPSSPSTDEALMERMRQCLNSIGVGTEDLTFFETVILATGEQAARCGR